MNVELDFPTSLLGSYPLEVIPIVIYGVNLIAANVIGFIWTLYVHRHPELSSEPITKSHVADIIPRYASPSGLYLVGMALAWILPWASYVIYLVVLCWLIYQYSTDRVRSAPRGSVGRIAGQSEGAE